MYGEEGGGGGGGEPRRRGGGVGRGGRRGYVGPAEEYLEEEDGAGQSHSGARGEGAEQWVPEELNYLL